MTTILETNEKFSKWSERDGLQKFRSRISIGLPTGVVISILVLGFFLIATIKPPLLQTHDPFAINLDATLQSPSFAHFFGTDQSGRDLFSRIVEGTRSSIGIGVGSMIVSLSIALVLGITAGLSGKILDGIVNRFIEVAFSFPNIFLALLFVAVFGSSSTTLILAIGIGTAPGYARMIRGQFIAVRNSGYVEAAKALGHPYWRIVRRHIFPNAIRPLVIMATLGVGQCIIWASALAFLGLGVAPPNPEWGALLDAGRNYVTHAWWLELLPGLAVVAFSLSLTTVGHFCQAAFELKGHSS